ncbi:predicted protein [Histoplasma capsulatum G186AR]|uniref:Uncharacterized protein n=1 Tax=Ajellomyces capsulatus (strain G186AR / H82 / ATCC MYA-2454 / RMSCC 2432) TaxID=447093 RepID=C0NS24_AJECG|nr:uncharacterized protein HCBG_05954 [Histoplasma capsulatum G186AR]EEH05690.1 predicted protein [Histoplasma capsulatum G186AR]
MDTVYQRFYITSWFLKPEHCLAPCPATIPFIRVFGFVDLYKASTCSRSLVPIWQQQRPAHGRTDNAQIAENAAQRIRIFIPSKQVLYQGYRSRPSIEDAGVTTETQRNNGTTRTQKHLDSSSSFMAIS